MFEDPFFTIWPVRTFRYDVEHWNIPKRFSLTLQSRSVDMKSSNITFFFVEIYIEMYICTSMCLSVHINTSTSKKKSIYIHHLVFDRPASYDFHPRIRVSVYITQLLYVVLSFCRWFVAAIVVVIDEFSIYHKSVVSVCNLFQH